MTDYQKECLNESKKALDELETILQKHGYDFDAYDDIHAPLSEAVDYQRKYYNLIEPETLEYYSEYAPLMVQAIEDVRREKMSRLESITVEEKTLEGGTPATKLTIVPTYAQYLIRIGYHYAKRIAKYEAANSDA